MRRAIHLFRSRRRTVLWKLFLSIFGWECITMTPWYSFTVWVSYELVGMLFSIYTVWIDLTNIVRHTDRNERQKELKRKTKENISKDSENRTLTLFINRVRNYFLRDQAWTLDENILKATIVINYVMATGCVTKCLSLFETYFALFNWCIEHYVTDGLSNIKYLQLNSSDLQCVTLLIDGWPFLTHCLTQNVCSEIL